MRLIARSKAARLFTEFVPLAVHCTAVYGKKFGKWIAYEKIADGVLRLDGLPWWAECAFYEGTQCKCCGPTQDKGPTYLVVFGASPSRARRRFKRLIREIMK